MAKFAVGALVQMKWGGIRGVVVNKIDADSDNPRAYIQWDDGTYSTHAESQIRAATVDEPRLYKKLA
ncbi:hypothetical protein [Enterobacter roggenkampii]|uniref:hypothetical protein n=1 Tax=Enterobacter roggenkampii TaxID=1812935 RepID=UPI00112236E5|nr:hypothetical protein [Enterobacter roggenkampii]EMF1898005.1 hypothetical protein [Enterobacter roggenkampii]TOY96043.1 hypothetical protein DI388_20785 [Escherichia coli]